MHRKLCSISKCNKFVQLVVQVQYHVNVIKSRGADTHTHARTYTNVMDNSNFKTRRALAIGWHVPVLQRALKL